MRLFTYCLRYDDGAAPNPFWDVCTLAICKPVIRRVAEIGEWIVGTGSVNSPQSDKSRHILYAMRVTKKMTMQEYDTYCRQQLRGKIPDWDNGAFTRKVGDCIYDFEDAHNAHPKLRKGVHNEANMETDLGGKNVLLSTHFYYWGNAAVPLPEHLHPILHTTQGHKSDANTTYVEDFETWLYGLNLQASTLFGEPQLKREIVARETDAACSRCAKRDRAEDLEDEKLGACDGK